VAEAFAQERITASHAKLTGRLSSEGRLRRNWQAERRSYHPALASKRADGGKVLRAAAQTYKVDTDAIALKVKQEFAAKAKSKEGKKRQAVSKPSQKRVA
jgi:hypothetical protein